MVRGIARKQAVYGLLVRGYRADLSVCGCTSYPSLREPSADSAADRNPEGIRHLIF